MKNKIIAIGILGAAVIKSMSEKVTSKANEILAEADASIKAGVETHKTMTRALDLMDQNVPRDKALEQAKDELYARLGRKPCSDQKSSDTTSGEQSQPPKS